jgi:hypothetical protein
MSSATAVTSPRASRTPPGNRQRTPSPAIQGGRKTIERSKFSPALSDSSSEKQFGAGTAQGPGGAEISELCILKGLKEATGGSGVMEARWGTGGTCPTAVRRMGSLGKRAECWPGYSVHDNKVFLSSRKGLVFIWDVNYPGKMRAFRQRAICPSLNSLANSHVISQIRT